MKEGVNYTLAKHIPYNDNHKEVEGVLYKKCNKHELYFPEEDAWLPATLEYYYNNSSSPDGLNTWCKKCTYKKAREWALTNPEKKREIVRKNSYKHNIREYHKINSQRQRDSGYRQEWEKTSNGIKSKIKSAKNRMCKEHKITLNEWIACKDYFKDSDGDWACAYCGLKAKNHYKKFKGILKLQDLHREHVDTEGSIYLDNCVPSCHLCNSSKMTLKLDDWYNINNPTFDQNKLNKITKWIKEDYKYYTDSKNK